VAGRDDAEVGAHGAAQDLDDAFAALPDRDGSLWHKSSLRARYPGLTRAFEE